MLSHMPAFYSMSSIVVDWMVFIMAKYAKNTFATNILDGSLKDDRYVVVDGLTCIRTKFSLYLIPKWRENFEDFAWCNHSWSHKLLQILSTIGFSWKGLKEDVLRHIRECTTCQHNKVEHTFPTSLLQPLPILNKKWENISCILSWVILKKMVRTIFLG